MQATPRATASRPSVPVASDAVASLATAAPPVAPVSATAAALPVVPAAAPTPAVMQPVVQAKRAAGPGVTVLAVLGVLIVAALMLRPSPRVAVAAVESAPDRPDASVSVSPAAKPAEPVPVPAVTRAVIPRAVVAAAAMPRNAAVVKHPVVDSVAPTLPVAPVAPTPLAEPAADLSSKEDSADGVERSEPARALPSALPLAADAEGPASVTITGCLEISLDQTEFRLTETDGVNAPKSRSWRSAFLKKRATPVALVDPPDPLALQTSVGQRVAATGRLTSRALSVSSVRVVGPSCS